jgi:two-component system OmpR family response regulator
MTALAMTVDDADDLRALVRTVLESNGFDVIEATSGRNALDALADGVRPDVIVLDVQMPDLDGWDTLTAIRAEPSTADLAVILCTVRAAQADIDHGWELGCDGFLPKPFAIDELARTVMEISGRTREERAERRASHHTRDDVAT